MVLAKLTVDGVCVHVSNKQKIPQGVVGAEIEIEYSDPFWAGLQKTVVFWGSSVKDVFDVGNVVSVPAEAVAKSGHRLRVGIYGIDFEGKRAVPTLWADLGYIEGSADPGQDPAVDPALPIWAQLQLQLGDLSKLQTETKQSLVAAVNELVAASSSAAGALEETLSKILDDITELKYVPIDITSISNNVGTKELGSSVDSVTVSWAVNKEPKSQTVQDESVDVAVRSKKITGPFTTGKSFTVTATDEKGKTDSESTSISFVNGVYYGVLEDGAEVDSAAILTLTRKLQGSKGLTFTANAGAIQRIVYALATRYGTPIFKVGGFDGGFSLVKTFNFTNASGYTESYDVWMSDNVGLGSTNVTVS